MWPLEELCGFAARDNPRRGFLVVSRVLGRHVATRPATMRRSFRDLACRIGDDLPGPVLIVGLAEMGVCLGQGVQEEYRRRTGRRDVAFIHSTRHALDRPLLGTFREAHSHAPFHSIYAPESPDVAASVRGARSLVLVDDEVSTGNTFINLFEALRPALPAVEVVVTAVLTDWSDRTYLERFDRPARANSLLSGHLTWTANPAVQPLCPQSPPSTEVHRLLPNFGRLGRLDTADEADGKADGLGLDRRKPVRLIGTGEFTYVPFRIAERLERQGYQVDVQATSRSPARTGGDIHSTLQFQCNYGEGVRQFLYNQACGHRGQVVICAETPAQWIDRRLIDELGARVLSLSESQCAHSF